MTQIASLDWSSVAAEWDAHRAHVETLKASLTEALVAGLDLAPGDRVLELGAGTGDLAARLAAAIPPGGTLIASDVAPGMVELIRARVAALPGVEVAQVDACDIGLPDGSVDALVFRMGLMLVPDPTIALTEFHRVLTPGGRLAVAVWDAPQHNPWLTSVGMAAMMHGLLQGPPPTAPGGPFSLADPAALESMLVDAGFTDVTVRAFDSVAQFADADAYVDTAGSLAPPLANAIRGASDEARVALRSTVDGLIARYRTNAGLRMPARSLLCRARRG
ncbi:MAG: methyltransferase domain-containing protein [Actinomycetota bacterium]|nr:methyltransferase domain-containing protein [Actinomycetota bacterium]